MRTVSDLNPYMRPNRYYLRIELYEKQDGKCVGCHDDIPIEKMTYDHIVPRSRGGGDDGSNIQLLCDLCNNGKDSMSQDLFLELTAMYRSQNKRCAECGKHETLRRMKSIDDELLCKKCFKMMWGTDVE